MPRHTQYELALQYDKAERNRQNVRAWRAAHAEEISAAKKVMTALIRQRRDTEALADLLCHILDDNEAQVVAKAMLARTPRRRR